MFRYVKNSLPKKIVVCLLVLSLVSGICGCTEQENNLPTDTPVSTPGPDDKTAPLFDEGYYAVLPGEGAYYHVYDCYGNVVGGFQNVSDFYANITGLYPKDEIRYAYNFATLHDVNQGKENQYQFTVNVTEHYYWTYDSSVGQIRVYDKQDNLFYETTAYPENEYGYWFMASGVLEVPKGLLVYVCEGWTDGIPNLEPPVLVQPDGTVTQLPLPENVRLTGALGADYLVVKSVVDSWEEGTYAICDYDGNIVVADIVPIIQSYSNVNEEAPLMGIFCMTSDSYVYQNQIYNAQLQPMEATLPAEYAGMPYAVLFGENGCVGEATYTVDGVDYTVNAINGTFVNAQGETQQYVFRLSDQKCIAQLSPNYAYVMLQDGYFIVHESDEDKDVFYVYDSNGKLRYQTDKNRVWGTTDDYIVLQRGPYIGIADLEGNYILKTIVPTLTSDSVREEVW